MRVMGSDRLSLWMTLWLLALCFWGGWAQARNKRSDKTRRLSWRFHSQMIAFQGVHARPSNLSATQYNVLMQAIRKGMEQSRFLPLNVPKSPRDSQEFVKKMVPLVVKRARLLAEKRAEWSSEFQGYKVTSKLLQSVQNQSFFYRIHFGKIQLSPEYKIRYKIKIYQLLIFDCTAANRKRSPKHEKACVGKKADDFVGIYQLFFTLEPDEAAQKITNEMSDSTKKANWKFHCNGIREAIRIQMRGLFPLYTPIAHTTREEVFLTLGKHDGLRLNSGLKIYVQHTSGLLLFRGYAKVRTLGDNRLKKKGNRWVRAHPKNPYFSRASTVFGRGIYRPRKGMLLKEYPMWGYHIGLQFGFLPVSSSLFADSPPSGGFQPLSFNQVVPSIAFTIGKDVSHQYGISELFFEAQGEIVLFAHSPGEGKDPAGSAFLASFGVIKKYNWRRLFFLLGARAGLGGMMDQGFLIGGDLYTGLELFLSPHIQLALRFGGRCYVPITFSPSFIGDYWLAGLWARAGFTFSF